MTLTPVHFQIRDDQAVGAALRRCVEALPAGWYMTLTRLPQDGRWHAIAQGESRTDAGFGRRADEPDEALDALTMALQETRA